MTQSAVARFEAGGTVPSLRVLDRLAARGLHTREVAAQLPLSTRTVDFHHGNVFAKLGISSRTELARLPFRVTRQAEVR